MQRPFRQRHLPIRCKVTALAYNGGAERVRALNHEHSGTFGAVR